VTDGEERVLWHIQQPERTVCCVLRTCCTGAELQLRIRVDTQGDEQTVLRELYPTKSDLYERACALEQDCRGRIV
jgi:hypothetical protein